MTQAAFDFETDSVNFLFDWNGQSVRGRITIEALQDHFQVRGNGKDAVDGYLQNSTAINAKAASIYQRTGRQPVVLRNSDFP